MFILTEPRAVCGILLAGALGEELTSWAQFVPGFAVLQPADLTEVGGAAAYNAEGTDWGSLVLLRPELLLMRCHLLCLNDFFGCFTQLLGRAELIIQKPCLELQSLLVI